MELRRYFSIAAGQLRLLLIVPIVAAVVAGGAAQAMSPRFEAGATVQIIPSSVDPRSVTFRGTDGPGPSALGLRDPTELLAQGITETLASQQTLEALATKLKLTSPPPPTGFEALKSGIRTLLSDVVTYLKFGYVVRPGEREALLAGLRDSLSVQLIRGSYYARVKATAADPAQAADLANAAVDVYLAAAKETATGQATERRRFLEGQVDEARRKVDQARDAVLSYAGGRYVVTPESIHTAQAALEEAQAALRRDAIALTDARRRLEEVERQISSTSPDTVTEQRSSGSDSAPTAASSRTTAPNPVYQTLQERVYSIQQEVAGLEARIRPDGSMLEDDARQLTDARRRLATAQRQLEATSPQITLQNVETAPASSSSASRVVAPNPLYQTLRETSLGLRQEIVALESRIEQQQAQATAREQELRELRVHDARLDALNQELSLATDVYSRRVAELERAALEEAQPAPPLRLIDRAVPPLYPVSPIRIAWILYGAAVGLALAIVVIFIRHHLDVSVRTAAEVERALDLRYLATVPAPNGAPRIFSSAQSDDAGDRQ